MKTHYAAVQNGLVIGTRTSASRHIDGTGKFGPYTHAIVRSERTVLKSDGSVCDERAEVISWHGGPANASAGLRAAKVGASFDSGYDYSSNGKGAATKQTTYLAAAIVEVVITPRPATIGAQASEGGR